MHGYVHGYGYAHVYGCMATCMAARLILVAANTAGRAEVSERRSWTGTSILRKLIIINWAGDYFIKTEDLLENAVIADLYMRGLLIDFD